MAYLHKIKTKQDIVDATRLFSSVGLENGEWRATIAKVLVGYSWFKRSFKGKSKTYSGVAVLKDSEGYHIITKLIKIY